jgi:N6-L-threonylcarbamoyladenine synthase
MANLTLQPIERESFTMSLKELNPLSDTEPATVNSVLGLETSCDETAASVVDVNGISSDVIWSQQVHAEYGGVVPELASRAHVDKVVSCTSAALKQAGIESPDLVCATGGPGLVGAVLVGFSFAKAMALGFGVPFLNVNHLEGHLLSVLLNSPAPKFPFLSFVVSGGHTTLYLARGIGDYVVLGQTIDDAVGEAYDKVSRLMGLGYPGGPIVDKLAEQGDPKSIAFPRAHRLQAKGKTRVENANRSALDMSFSGLKSAVRNYLERTKGWQASDVAASFQAAVMDVLVDRVVRAMQDTDVRRISIGGGVAANTEFRRRLMQLDAEVYLPPKSRCTDNGSMIANVGRLRYNAGFRSHRMDTVRSRWSPDTDCYLRLGQ